MKDDKLPGYFIEQTNFRLTRIEDKLDKLIAFKWQIFTGVTLLSALLTIGVQVGVVFFSK